MDKTAKDRMARYRNRKRDNTVTKTHESVTLSDGQVLRLGNHGYTGEDKFTGYQCPKSWGSNWVGFQQAMGRSNKAQQFTPVKELTEAERARVSGLGIPESVVKCLIHPERRAGMIAVVERLKAKNLLHEVSLGVGENSMPLDVVNELLEITA